MTVAPISADTTVEPASRVLVTKPRCQPAPTTGRAERHRLRQHKRGFGPYDDGASQWSSEIMIFPTETLTGVAQRPSIDGGEPLDRGSEVVRLLRGHAQREAEILGSYEQLAC